MPGAACRGNGNTAIPRVTPSELAERGQAALPAVIVTEKNVVALCFAVRGATLAAALADPALGDLGPGLLGIITLPERKLGTPWKGHLGPVNALAFAPDSDTLASGGGDRSIRLWAPATGTNKAVWTGPWPAGREQDRPMLHVDPIEAVAFSPDGQTVATATGSPSVTLWNVSDHTIRRRFADSPESVRALAFAPDGARLAVGDDGKTVTLVDLLNGKKPEKFIGHLGPITSIAFSADGRLVATGSRDASATLWSRDETTRERAVLARHTSGVTCVALSPDGKMAATGARDWTIKIWDATSGQMRHSLEGHHDAVCGVAFSADGATLASSSRDGTFRLWDAGKGLERAVQKPLAGPLGPVAWLPRERAFITGGDDGALSAVAARRRVRVGTKKRAPRPGNRDRAVPRRLDPGNRRRRSRPENLERRRPSGSQALRGRGGPRSSHGPFFRWQVTRHGLRKRPRAILGYPRWTCSGRTDLG